MCALSGSKRVSAHAPADVRQARGRICSRRRSKNVHLGRSYAKSWDALRYEKLKGFIQLLEFGIVSNLEACTCAVMPGVVRFGFGCQLVSIGFQYVF